MQIWPQLWEVMPRIEDPNDIVGAFQRARIKTEEGTAVLLEFITSAETDYSIKRPF